MDLKGHLRRQLGFLERSCAGYDAGFRDETIRIATIIRVMLHDTKSSTSLLQHLDATTINLLSTRHEIASSCDFAPYMGTTVRRGEGQFDYVPLLGLAATRNFVPSRDWWEQVVMVLVDHRIKRRDVVLAAANKDGGAHVDTKLTAEYEALARDGALGSLGYFTKGVRNTAPIEGGHMLALRQFGYELLNSPDLTQLART